MEYYFSIAQLLEFSPMSLLLIALVFIWSGFVRSGLGFGGTALSLPLLLMIHDSPIYWLPIVGSQLLIFSALALSRSMANVDWVVLRKTSVYILPAKLAGVFGLISLPAQWLVIIIYTITLVYGVLWMFNLTIRGGDGWIAKLFLLMGGYFSGTSLTGAPPIVAVYTQMVKITQLRDTLFVLWFFLVTIKLMTLVAFDVNLQLASTLILAPVALVGHIIGLKVHQAIMQNSDLFRRVIGAALMGVCVLGLGRTILGASA
jgi:uncharacterized membrane protein YfcA